MASGRVVIILILLACAVARAQEGDLLDAGAAPGKAQVVGFASGDKRLHGLLYAPPGAGPFPAVLYNHGSAAGLTSNAAFELLGPVFAARGWVFFAPYRRGQGLSSDAGPYIEDEISAARSRGGPPEAERTLLRLLSTDHLQDQLAALSWLKSQSFVLGGQVAVMGNSFGGIETLLGAEQGGYCAAVDAAGGAQSWDMAPGLRALMRRAAGHSSAPVLFLQAHNDYSLAPSRELYATMRSRHLDAQLRIFPAFGSSAADGHSFAWRGVSVWSDSVFDFLEQKCRR